MKNKEKTRNNTLCCFVYLRVLRSGFVSFGADFKFQQIAEFGGAGMAQ